MRRPRGERKLGDRLHAVGHTSDAEGAVGELDVVGSDLQLVRRDLARLLFDLLRRVPERDSAHGKGTGAVRVHPERRDRGVAVQNLDVVERNAELVGRDLRPRGHVALAVRRRPRHHRDLAGGMAANRCRVPTAGTVLECREHL